MSLVLESEESTECWVSGRVHLVKGEFVVAIFDVNGVKPQDIFPSDRVRRPNKKWASFGTIIFDGLLVRHLN